MIKSRHLDFCGDLTNKLESSHTQIYISVKEVMPIYGHKKSNLTFTKKSWRALLGSEIFPSLEGKMCLNHEDDFAGDM